MAYFRSNVSGGIPAGVRTLPTVDTASGAIATFNTDLTENLVSVKCQIVAKQASGTPSPVNPLPITVYNSLMLGQDANYDKFLDFNQKINYTKFVSRSATDYTITPNNDGSVTVDILNAISSSVIVYLTANNSVSYVKVPYGHKFAIVCDNLPSNVMFVNGMDGMNWNITIRNQGRSDGYIYIGLRFLSGLAVQTFTIYPMILDLTQMFGETLADEIYNMEQQTAGSGVAYVRNLLPNSYYDYTASTIETLGTANNDGTGNTYNIPFGQTVANGVLDITTGKLRVTHGIKLINDLPLGYVSSNDFFYVQLPEKAKNDNYLCECLNNIGLKNDTQMATANNNSIAYAGAEVKIKYTDTTNVSALKTAIGSYKFVYELATPIEIQLDSITLQALLNENNVWCDTGDTEVKFLLTVGKKIS